MVVDPIRLYLLAGLLFHKGLWEVLKRRQGGGDAENPEPLSFSLKALTKMVKIGILLAICAQTLLPVPYQIAGDPSARIAAGVLLFSVGLATAVFGRLQLGSNWSDIEAAGVLPEQRVVDGGIYRYIRHPIYTGDILLLIGLELALNTWLVLAVFLLMPVILRQAIQEEGMLRLTLPGYEDYCRRSKRFVPLIW